MPTIAELEAAVRVEEEAVERAYVAANPVSIAMYTASLRRASEALTAALVAEQIAADPMTECDCGVCP